MAEHSGTHIDALCHQAYDGVMHGGVEATPQVQTPTGFTELGIDTVAPIVRRGVLLDVAPCSAVGPGRAGRLRRRTSARATWCSSGSARARCSATRPRIVAAGGVTADGSRWLAARKPFAVGADNLAWDAVDGHDPELGSIPGHTILIVQAGIHIIESLYLEELAADGVREFGFICLPLKFRGGTGSPVRPIALV